MTFSHQFTTSAGGHVEIKAPCGKCRLESAYPVRVDGKRYVWTSDVVIAPERSTVDLIGESVQAQDGMEPRVESDPIPTAAVGGAEPSFPTGDVVLPVLIVGVEAEFPELAKTTRIEGKVILQAVIGIDGLVTGATVLSSSNPMFNSSAIQATSQRMYRPARQHGQPVAIYFTIRVDFRLR